MKIRDVLRGIDYQLLQKGNENWEETEVTGLIYDSRKVTEGSAFACENGTVYDGIDFLNMAGEKGAVLAVMDKQPFQFPAGVSMVLVGDVMDAESRMAANFYPEALEDICDTYMLDHRILYIKTAFVYWFYPLTAMLQLYLVAPIKHKRLMALPYMISLAVVFADIFDTRLIYYFDEDHSFNGGAFANMPVAVLCFYIVMLGMYSLMIIIKRGDRRKGVVALFMTVTAVLSAIGENIGFARGMTEEVTAIELLIYYFFLAAINYSETQESLYKSRIELERQRLKLLVVQMQPHFIFNALATIQSLCYTDSEAAADCIDVFGDYLRANINSISSEEPIDFEAELEHCEQFIKLEKASRDVDFIVVYDLKVRDFKVPPLTVQPIVENAIKYGALSRRDGSGMVKIVTEECGGMIVISVADNGTGASMTTTQKEHHSVGLENTRRRLEIQCGGTPELEITENGSAATIKLPKTGGSGE